MIKINEETKLIGRFYPGVNNRGINIYNPYFAQAEVNAIYLLFANEDPEKLISGMRSLSLSGAIVAGSFEKDPSIPPLLDEVHPISKDLGTIGMVANRGGRLWGLYQGGYGLHDSILENLQPVAGKSVSLVGAGNVAHALLLVLKERNDLPTELTIYNRTLKNAEALAAKFEFVTGVGSIADLETSASGDILINASQVGSAWCTDPGFNFTHSIVSKFESVADVAFVPIKTELSKICADIGRKFAPGHQMFLHQAKTVLREMLDHSMLQSEFERIMLADFQKNWS